MNQLSKRDKLRAATLGAKTNFKTKIIKHEGEDFELRQMTIKARADIGRKSMDENGNIDPFNWRIFSLIACVFDPVSGEQVYDDSDFEMLSALPADCFIDSFAEALAEMTNVSTDESKKPLKRAPKSA